MWFSLTKAKLIFKNKVFQILFTINFQCKKIHKLQANFFIKFQTNKNQKSIITIGKSRAKLQMADFQIHAARSQRVRTSNIRI